MSELEVKPAKVKKEDNDSGKYKSVLEKSSQKDNLKNNISKENISQEDTIQIKSLLSDNITEEKFRAEVEKITDKGTLIKAVNSVADLYIKYGKEQYIDYKFKVLIDRFKTLFGVEECDKCFEDTFEKIKHHNDLRSISEDYNFDYDLVDKPKNKKKWWPFGKNKKSKKKKNKDKGFKSTDGSFVSYSGQRKKFNKTKKAQAKGKGNWRLVAKHTFSVSGTALLCGVLNFIIPQPLGGILSLLTAGISGALIYRDVKNKSKYRKKISNRIGGTIDKLEETNDKYNTKKMENELSKFEKEEKKLDSSSKKNDKDDKVKNQQNQTVNQNQQNPMMQNQMMQNQNQQNPMMQQMMQNQMMQDPIIQQYMQNQLWQQMAQNPMMQQMMQNPMMQQQIVNQLWQQMMQNPTMQQYVQNKITNQFPQFQQIGTQNQQIAQTQPVVQQNTTQPQTVQTHTQKLQQQTTTNGTEVSM